MPAVWQRFQRIVSEKPLQHVPADLEYVRRAGDHVMVNQNVVEHIAHVQQLFPDVGRKRSVHGIAIRRDIFVKAGEVDDDAVLVFQYDETPGVRHSHVMNQSALVYGVPVPGSQSILSCNCGNVQ